MAKVLGGIQHLIDATPGLDRAGDGQVAVQLDPELSGDILPGFCLQTLLHFRNGPNGGFQNAAGGNGLRKDFPEIGGKPFQPVAGIAHIGKSQGTLSDGLGAGDPAGIDPGGFLQGCYAVHDGVFLPPLRQRLSQNDFFRMQSVHLIK